MKLPQSVRPCSFRLPFWPGKFPTLYLLLALGAANVVHGQFQPPTAQIIGQPVGGGLFNYSVTLRNNLASISSIQTFWISWAPGEDFLPSKPTSVQAPPGWSYSIAGGPYSNYGYTYPDGYSIEFTSSSAPIAAGASLNFGFVSTDSPGSIAGSSSIYYGTPILTSFIYSGIGESGYGSEFVVQVVPEPSVLAILGLGSAAGLLYQRQRSRQRLGAYEPSLRLGRLT